MSLIVRSTRERVVKLSIAAILCLGLAAWCWYDLKYKYIGEEYTTDSEKAFTRKSNQVLGPGLALLGTVAIFFAIKAIRLRYEADEETGISVNGQPPIPWSVVTDIDTSVLAKKGYLFVKYRDPQDQEATLKLDEFNLDYFDELYAMIRSKLGLPSDSPAESESSPTA